VLTDRWLRFLDRSGRVHVLVQAVAFAVAGGPGAAAVCVCARTAAGMLGHWFVGYAAHTWGERRFVVVGASESGTNLPVLGVLSFGEGFHNNHHAFPRSPRMGLRAREFDLGWLSLLLLERAGLARGVRAAEPRLEPEAIAARGSTFPTRDVLAAGCREPDAKPA
jgi:fatty-acid desaturase